MTVKVGQVWAHPDTLLQGQIVSSANDEGFTLSKLGDPRTDRYIGKEYWDEFGNPPRLVLVGETVDEYTGYIRGLLDAGWTE